MRIEGEPGGGEFGHSAKADPEGLGAGWSFGGSVVVAAQLRQESHEFRQHSIREKLVRYEANQDSLVAWHNAYLTEPRALQTPLFVDHHGRGQALVNVHPTSNFQRTPVRLTRPVTRLATVW